MEIFHLALDFPRERVVFGLMIDETAPALTTDASTFDLGALRGLIQEKTQAEENPLVDVLGVGDNLELQAKILTGSEGLSDYSARRNYTMFVMRGLEFSEEPSADKLDGIMKSARQKTEKLIEAINSKAKGK